MIIIEKLQIIKGKLISGYTLNNDKLLDSMTHLN